MNTQQRQVADRQMIASLIDDLRAGLPDTTLEVAAHSTLESWLQRYAKAADQPWQKQALAWIIDPDAHGLALAYATPARMSARQILRFYGYPYAQTPAQRGVLIDALGKRQGFADSPGFAPLQNAFEALHQDLQTLSRELRALVSRLDLDEETFTLFALYRTRCWLSSGSYWADAMNRGAALVQSLTEHPDLLALAPDADLYAFDPVEGTLSGGRNEISHAQLSTLPTEAQFDSLVEIGTHMQTVIYKDARFTLAQLLKLHSLPLPATRDEAWDVIEQLQRIETLAVPAGCDFASSELALLHYDSPAKAHPTPRWGNYWATLGLPKPGALTLSVQQRTDVKAVVAAFLADTCAGLLTVLLGTPPSADPDECLHRLLNSPAAQRLADRLIRAVGWYGHAPGEPTNRASRDALVLGALILSLDPLAGETRYRVAGLDLNHPAFWGCNYAELRLAIELHLIDQGIATAQTAALVAHLLLAGVAPECLVRDIPDSLYFMSSYAWMIFKQGVLQAESLAAGSTRQLTFIDIMTLATHPGPAAERPWREHCATSSLIDWGLAQGQLPPGADHNLDALQTLKQQLELRVQALRAASKQLVTPLITRRAIARADLQTIFPNHSLLEKACLRWVKTPGNAPPFRRSTSRPQSLLDLHMSGDLQPISPKWHSTDPQLDLDALKPRFKYLKTINTVFDHAADAHVARLKSAYTHAIQYLLAQLPLADRQSLQLGALQLWVLRLPAQVPLDQESPAHKAARTGRYGVLLRCEHHTVVTYFELFPLFNQVRKNPRLPSSLQAGGWPLSVATGSPTSTHPRSQLFTGSRLAIDWSAYAQGSPPKVDQWASVITDPLPFDIPASSDELLHFDSPRCLAIARAITDKHFFLDVDALLTSARSSNSLEDQRRVYDSLADVLLNLIPFWACARGLASGDTRQMIDGAWSCFFDVLGVFVPTQVFASRAAAALRRTLPVTRKLLQLSKLSALYLNATLNPLESLPFVLRLGVYGWVRLKRAGLHLIDEALGHARRRLVQGAGIDYRRLVNRADVGSAQLIHAEGATPLLAVHRDAGWHGFDPFSGRPYGPTLDGLRLDSALVINPVHRADGYLARVVEPLFETPPLIIQRTDATDLLEPHRVWRWNPQNPGHLDDIASPAHVHLSDRFELTCAAGRTKRSPVPTVCFSKRLYPFRGSIHKRRVQALDHIRLTPGPVVAGAKRKLVWHRHVHEVDADFGRFKLTPLPTQEALIYKPQVRARRIDGEPQFGLPGDELDNLLNHQSQVVRLESIFDGVDDSRTLRAATLSLPTADWWVVEADVGLFYKTVATPLGPDTLQMQQLDFSLGGDDQALIQAFCSWRNQHFSAGGMLPDQPLVALPTLETLYRQLTQRGFTPARLARLRSQASRLSVMKQRELLLNASDQGRRLDVNVVNQPIQLEVWPPRPPALGAPTAEQINRYMAEQANASLQRIVDTTLIGRANSAGIETAELRRLRVAEPIVMWEYSKIGHPDYSEIILKTGAGNCDQMAHIACESIRTNGGTARVWSTWPPAHAFVIVGTPPAGVMQTRNFSEAGWQDVWVSDPWASITCPAAQYLAELEVQMNIWGLQDIHVRFYVAGLPRWTLANDPVWIAQLKNSDKQPNP